MPRSFLCYNRRLNAALSRFAGPNPPGIRIFPPGKRLNAAKRRLAPAGATPAPRNPYLFERWFLSLNIFDIMGPIMVGPTPKRALARSGDPMI